MGNAILIVDKVSRSFRGLAVLSECSFEVGPGETILLLGANGSGKSTLLRILAGLLRSESGSCASRAGRRALHAHQLMLYGELTVEENLRLFAQLSGDDGVEDALRRWRLEPHRQRFLHQLSKGLQARVSLARTFSTQSALYLLDEPSSALDDAATEELCRMIEEKRSGGASVVVATHDLARLSSSATRAMVLSRGQIAFDSSVAGAPVLRAIEEYRVLNR